MNIKMKQWLQMITYAIVLLCFLMNLPGIFAGIQYFLVMIEPITVGLILAFVFNVPMKKIEGCLKKINKKISPKVARGLALFLTLMVVALIIALLLGTIVPQMITSAATAISQLEDGVPRLEKLIAENGHMSVGVKRLLDQVQDVINDSKNVTKTLGSLISQTVSTILTLGTQAFQFMISVIIMIYLLLDKERMQRQAKVLMEVFLPERWKKTITKVGKTACSVYEDFFTGQCIEATILATLMIVTFQLCRLPYGILVGVLAGVLAFVPYIGSFIACATGVILTLFISPWKALLVFVVYQIVQFIEGQFIYPRVVGKSVGLPPIWIVIAILLGGNLFGVVGILFAIPVMATIYTLLKEEVNKRQKKKEMEQSPTVQK